jgi:type IV secretory pathway TrbL component
MEATMNSAMKAVAVALAVAGFATLTGPASAAVRPQMPAEQHQGSVGFVTGGIGEAEARMFKRQMGQHRLAIELLEHAGKAEEFTADARVRIADAHGRTVLDTQAGGPFLLVDLPPGRYSIVATLNHRTLRKPAVVVMRNKMARATFEFPPRTDG